MTDRSRTCLGKVNAASIINWQKLIDDLVSGVCNLENECVCIQTQRTTLAQLRDPSKLKDILQTHLLKQIFFFLGKHHHQ